MRAILGLVLLTALRDRLFAGLLGLLGAVLALALFLGNAILVEQAETARVFAAGGVRLLLAVGLVTFVAFQIQRLYETREIEAMLARPVSRLRFVAALAAAIAAMAVLLALAGAATVAVLLPPWAGFAVWAASLTAEVVVLGLFTMAAALVFERAVPATLTACVFYVAARSMSLFTAVAEARSRVFDSGAADMVFDGVLQAVAAILPRFDLFARSVWLVDGPDGADALWLPAAQVAVYVPLLVVVAALDLRRKRF